MINDVRPIKPKVMLLTKQLNVKPTGGRELLCKLNHDAMQEIYGDQLVLYELPHQSLHGIGYYLKAFKGHIDGLDESIIDNALRIIMCENISKVLIDGSNLGVFAEHLKKKLPNISVTTFFHNVEARFFLGSLLQQKTLKALAVLACNYLAEKSAVKFSNQIICMSERDSRLLQKVYGRAATHISPMALRDKMPIKLDKCDKPRPEKFALFVGGNFYANRAGITWFVKHVVPHIQIKICIVGHGFEDYKEDLECEGKVNVIGGVDNLDCWYREAHFVIAPIFDGSGMKTKVAEALMFGKKIVGTPEAFSGYENVVKLAGWCCETVDDFVHAISCARSEIKLSFDPELRQLYMDFYSQTVAKERLERILSK